ncbi:MAG: methylmalonyl-CoA mutase family protein, partial [Vicinamibacterales bacterium]
DESTTDRQMARLEQVRRRRDQSRVDGSLAAIRSAAATTENLMPCIIDAVRAYATLGEMCDALRDVWGEWEETPAV